MRHEGVNVLSLRRQVTALRSALAVLQNSTSVAQDHMERSRAKQRDVGRHRTRGIGDWLLRQTTFCHGHTHCTATCKVCAREKFEITTSTSDIRTMKTHRESQRDSPSNQRKDPEPDRELCASCAQELERTENKTPTCYCVNARHVLKTNYRCQLAYVVHQQVNTVTAGCCVNFVLNVSTSRAWTSTTCLSSNSCVHHEHAVVENAKFEWYARQ